MRATASAGRSSTSFPEDELLSVLSFIRDVTSVSPSLTAWPSSTLISFTTPGSSASTGISIFIDSRITTVSPSSTESPGDTSIFQTVPVMCASIAAKLASCRVGGSRSAPEYPPWRPNP